MCPTVFMSPHFRGLFIIGNRYVRRNMIYVVQYIIIATVSSAFRQGFNRQFYGLCRVRKKQGPLKNK